MTETDTVSSVSGISFGLCFRQCEHALTLRVVN